MRNILLIAVAIFATPASAATLDPVKCLAEATSRLPRSVTVKNATTRAMSPSEAQEYPSGPALWVDVSVTVVGQETSYRFVCALTRIGQVVRRRRD